MPNFVEKYYGVVDKSSWGDGPWQGEPDKAVWVDEETGLDCMIVRGPSGALCGYVGVGPDHPLHGRDYNECLAHGVECEERWNHKSPESAFDVHGGLTFADRCANTDDPSKHICHIPQEGRPHNVWWFGFDCAHYNDLTPLTRADHRRLYEEAVAKGDQEGMRLWGPGLWGEGTYRNLDYVIGEVRSLAKQLAA